MNLKEETLLKSHDISKYLGHGRQLPRTNVNFSKPIEIGAFSIDGKRKFKNDRSQLAYLEDEINLQDQMSLSDGFKDRFIKRDESVKERLDHLLRWVVSNMHRFDKSETQKAKDSVGKFPDFILWRGHMTKIMCTPYENQDGWIMAVQMIGSTIYISEVETADSAHKRLNRTDRENLMTYWGVRYEKYMTRPDPPSMKTAAKVSRLSGVDQSSVVVNTNEAYCTVVRAKLNDHNIIHSAEVDCCFDESNDLTPPDSYVELKTNRIFSSRKQEDNFHRYKTKKWWAQSFLAGVPQITCGFRDDNGIVVDTQHYKTLDLPRMARKVLTGGWDATVCLDFLNDFFSFVNSVVKECDESPVFMFSWKPGQEKISFEKYSVPTVHEFIPTWYKTSLKYF